MGAVSGRQMGRFGRTQLVGGAAAGNVAAGGRTEEDLNKNTNDTSRTLHGVERRFAKMAREARKHPAYWKARAELEYGELKHDRNRLWRWLWWIAGRCAANDPKPYPLALLRDEIRSALAGLTVQQHIKRGCAQVDVRATLRGKPPRLGVGNQQP